MNISFTGIDIAKHIFHVIGLDPNGKQVLKKKLRRTLWPGCFCLTEVGSQATQPW